MDVERLMGRPRSLSITGVIKENKSTKTVLFDLPEKKLIVRPGQFLMVWVPGVDEVPMGISLWDPPTMGVTVKVVGPATERLASMEEGDLVGIRGPFGNHFDLASRRALVVGGGIGMAPLRPLISHLLVRDTDVTLIIAAKTKDELILYDYANRVDGDMQVEVATDDGSMGFEGLANDLVEELITGRRYDTIYACGPELMMYGLLKIARQNDIRLQASLERYMKCGCGICGTCSLDPSGKLVCIEGPVFDDSELVEFAEFGKYHRDSTGVKQRF